MGTADLPTPRSDVAFSAAVKAIQTRKGSRGAYARMEAKGGWQQTIDDELKSFVEAQVSVFLATASADGQPYVQHRGGPPGFLKVLDAHTIAFADFAGNRQYISQGNLSENPKAQLFLIDYAARRRIKIWGTARVVEGDTESLARLKSDGYPARAEQVLLFAVSAWDSNCPQHIPRRFDAVDVRRALEERDARIAELESALAAARSSAAAV
jgi:uncharacterized protein